MKEFNHKVIKQLHDLYDTENIGVYKELIMALFMQIFSYHYDDQIKKSIKYENIEDIVKKYGSLQKLKQIPMWECLCFLKKN